MAALLCKFELRGIKGQGRGGRHCPYKKYKKYKNLPKNTPEDSCQ
jgi:hypothetical protein